MKTSSSARASWGRKLGLRFWRARYSLIFPGRGIQKWLLSRSCLALGSVPLRRQTPRPQTWSVVISGLRPGIPADAR